MTKVAARNAANEALRKGVLARRPCDACGADGAQMHHEDYALPLDVTWLCSACHTALHVTRGDLKAKRNGDAR